MGDRFVILSGCSGGGKSALLDELQRRGRGIVEEPGRRIVREELERGGHAVPWIDEVAFARRALETAIGDWEAAQRLAGWVFFDRGIVDAACALEHLTAEPAIERFGRMFRYHPTAFLVPPWREIYAVDAERRHGLEAAMAEYERLLSAYDRLRYRVVVLPKCSVAARADLVLADIGASGCQDGTNQGRLQR